MQNELETIQQIYNVVTEFIINYSFQIVGAFIILNIMFPREKAGASKWTPPL